MPVRWEPVEEQNICQIFANYLQKCLRETIWREEDVYTGDECIVSVRWKPVEKQSICKIIAKYLEKNWGNILGNICPGNKLFCRGDVCTGVECIVPVRWKLAEELEA